jgi:hypothetical protein
MVTHEVVFQLVRFPYAKRSDKYRVVLGRDECHCLKTKWTRHGEEERVSEK